MSSRLKILVLGARGRLGAALTRLYAADHEVTALGREQLDLLRLSQIRDRLSRHSFDALINAAGITSVDYCEDHPDEAHDSNAAGPEIIAKVCHERGARLLHLSTDYVFDGAGRSLCRETDPTAPLNEYGRSKLAGERLVLAACPSALVLRVSWLFGPDKDSFPDRVVKTALAEDRVTAIADKWSSPTHAGDLAGWMLPFLQEHRAASGLLHLCNAGHASWQEYGQKALDLAAQLGLPLRARTVEPVSMHGFAEFKAARPPFTSLDTSRFTEITGIKPRRWEEALLAYLTEKYAKA